MHTIIGRRATFPATVRRGTPRSFALAFWRLARHGRVAGALGHRGAQHALVYRTHHQLPRRVVRRARRNRAVAASLTGAEGLPVPHQVVSGFFTIAILHVPAMPPISLNMHLLFHWGAPSAITSIRTCLAIPSIRCGCAAALRAAPAHPAHALPLLARLPRSQPLRLGTSPPAAGKHADALRVCFGLACTTCGHWRVHSASLACLHACTRCALTLLRARLSAAINAHTAAMKIPRLRCQIVPHLIPFLSAAHICLISRAVATSRTAPSTRPA